MAEEKKSSLNVYPGFCRIRVAGRLGSEWVLGFNITPVVPNFIDRYQGDVNLMENINLMADPDKNLVMIMKDGKVYNNTL